METNNRLAVLLKNPTETGSAIDSILKEIKEESTKIYDEVFKDFSGDYKKEYRELRNTAEQRIEIKSKEIRNKYFDALDRNH